MAVRRKENSERGRLESWVRSWTANEMMLVLDLVGGNSSGEGNLMPTPKEKEKVHELWFDCNEPFGGPMMDQDIETVLTLSDTALAVMRTAYDAHKASLKEGELFLENFHLKNGTFHADSVRELGDRWRLVYYLSDERDVGAGFVRCDSPVLVSYPDGELAAYLSKPDDNGRCYGTRWNGFSADKLSSSASVGKMYLCNATEKKLDIIDVTHTLIDGILKGVSDPEAVLMKYDGYCTLGGDRFTEKEVISAIDRIAGVRRRGGDPGSEARKRLESLPKGIKAMIFTALCPHQENWLRNDHVFPVRDIVRAAQGAPAPKRLLLKP